MITSDLLKNVINQQRKIFLATTNSIEREILDDKDFTKICMLKEIIIITGVRRSGKSYLMRLIWQKIAKEKSLTKNNFLYLNFEDEKLIGFRAADFELLMESYLELLEPNKKQKIYFFFDEIQVVPGWEKFLNRLLENGKYKIFVTGSNASLLSKEISSTLTGRNYPLSLLPLSFREFIWYKTRRKFVSKDNYSQETRITIKKLFREYLNIGGFPEVVLQNFRPLTQEYLKNIIYRDIVLRYGIRQEASLREISTFLISNIGAIFSLEQISKMTKVKNIMTVKNYLTYLENSFLFYLVAKHSYSIKNQIYNPDKIYIIDPGMYQEVAFISSPNEGRLLENIVFLELIRKSKNVYYFRESEECDFVVQEKNKVTEAIQVTKELSVLNRDREINGLIEAINSFNLKEGLILTKDESDELKIGNKKITVKPIWKWLLE